MAGTCDGVGSRNDKCPSLPNVAAFRFVAASCGHLSDLQGLAKKVGRVHQTVAQVPVVRANARATVAVSTSVSLNMARNLEPELSFINDVERRKSRKPQRLQIQPRLWGQDPHTSDTMLAAHRDRENIYSQAPGTTKQQVPTKTPGARGHKTPFRVPLKDENANTGLGGKTLGGNGLGRSGKTNAQTPAGTSQQLPGHLECILIVSVAPRTGRAPLGAKTTNAKARPTPGAGGVKHIVQQLEKTTVKTTVKPTTTVRPRHAAPRVETAKVEVQTDRNPLDYEEDVEYAPPRVKDIPYESDLIPDGALTFEGLKPENLFKGYHDFYFNPVDDTGTSAHARQLRARRQRDLMLMEDDIMKDVDQCFGMGAPRRTPASKKAFRIRRDSISRVDDDFGPPPALDSSPFQL